MDLPSFLWLWRIAAWSMGLTVTLYIGLAIVGGMMRGLIPQAGATHFGLQRAPLRRWLRWAHYSMGMILVGLVLLLLAIGVVGTLGHFGSLGHSWHLPAGLTVVGLTLASAWSATRIHPQRPWAKPLHLALNGFLLIGLMVVSISGWIVVQKYLP
jgi:hypothetical protein